MSLVSFGRHHDRIDMLIGYTRYFWSYADVVKLETKANENEKTATKEFSLEHFDEAPQTYIINNIHTLEMYLEMEYSEGDVLILIHAKLLTFCGCSFSHQFSIFFFDTDFYFFSRFS